MLSAALVTGGPPSGQALGVFAGAWAMQEFTGGHVLEQANHGILFDAVFCFSKEMVFFASSGRRTRDWNMNMPGFRE